MAPLDSAARDALDPLVLWLIVIVADALFGGLPGLRRALSLPLAAVDQATAWLDRKLNRERRSVANRLLRGLLIVCVLVLAAAAAGRIVAALARSIPSGWLIEAAALACLILQRRVIDPMRTVARALAGHDLDAGRAALSGLVLYDSAGVDTHAVARGTVEVGTARFCDGVVAAVFWYLLLGLPGICAYRAINVIADRIGDGAPRHEAFGLAAKRLDEVVGALPGLIAGGLLCLSAFFVPGAKPAQAFEGWLGSFRGRNLFDSGRALGVVGGALDLALAAPRRARASAGAGRVTQGRAQATATDVVRAAILLVTGSLIAAAALAAMFVLHGLA